MCWRCADGLAADVSLPDTSKGPGAESTRDSSVGDFCSFEFFPFFFIGFSEGVTLSLTIPESQVILGFSSVKQVPSEKHFSFTH